MHIIQILQDSTVQALNSKIFFSSSSLNHLRPQPHLVLLSLYQSRPASSITLLSSSRSSWIIFPVLVQILEIEAKAGIRNVTLLISLDRHLQHSRQINRTFRAVKYEYRQRRHLNRLLLEYVIQSQENNSVPNQSQHPPDRAQTLVRICNTIQFNATLFGYYNCTHLL